MKTFNESIGASHGALFVTPEQDYSRPGVLDAICKKGKGVAPLEQNEAARQFARNPRELACDSS